MKKQMRQLYNRSPERNFGDDLNIWFWDEVLPGWRDRDDLVTLVDIETIVTCEPERAAVQPLQQLMWESIPKLPSFVPG